MKAVRKKPGEPPEIVDVENTLEALQAEIRRNAEQTRRYLQTTFTQ